MNVLWLLVIEFFKVGLFAIGGGLASIPFLTEISLKYNWYSLEDLTTMIAVSESTPGPLGVNMATYVGYMISGLMGAIVATISLILPSLIIVSIIARYLNRFRNSKIVQSVFNGLKPAVIAFIISACLDIFISSLFNLETAHTFFEMFNYGHILFLGILLCVSHFFPKIHPIFYILMCSIVGIIFSL